MSRSRQKFVYFFLYAFHISPSRICPWTGFRIFRREAEKDNLWPGQSPAGQRKPGWPHIDKNVPCLCQRAAFPARVLPSCWSGKQREKWKMWSNMSSVTFLPDGHLTAWKSLTPRSCNGWKNRKRQDTWNPRLVPAEEFEIERKYLLPYYGEPVPPKTRPKEYHVQGQYGTVPDQLLQCALRHL